MPLIHKTLWLVKEVVVVVGGGGSKYYGHYKMTPPSHKTDLIFGIVLEGKKTLSYNRRNTVVKGLN